MWIFETIFSGIIWYFVGAVGAFALCLLGVWIYSKFKE